MSAFEADAPPFRRDKSGALRVGKSRVLVELVLRAFQDGATPETIVQRYSTLTLAEVYAVIAYYLCHMSLIETYLQEREQTASDTQTRIESKQNDLAAIRKRLQSRKSA